MSVGGCRILVIDDDANCAKELCLLLAEAGLPAEFELSAADGIRRFLSDPDFHVVLSDLRMPDCDGIDFLRLIRGCCARGATASLILVTGHPEAHTPIDALKLGVSAILLKPLDPVKVVHAVARAVDLQTEPKSEWEPWDTAANGGTFRARKAANLDDLTLEEVLSALRDIVRTDLPL